MQQSELCDYNTSKLVWHLSDHMYKWSAVQGEWTDTEILLLVYGIHKNIRTWEDMRVTAKYTGDYILYLQIMIT